MTDLDRLDALAAAVEGDARNFRRRLLGQGRLTPEEAEFVGVVIDPGTIRSLVAAVRERDERRAIVDAAIKWEHEANHRQGYTGNLLQAEDELADAIHRAALNREDGADR